MLGEPKKEDNSKYNWITSLVYQDEDTTTSVLNMVISWHAHKILCFNHAILPVLRQGMKVVYVPKYTHLSFSFIFVHLNNLAYNRCNSTWGWTILPINHNFHLPWYKKYFSKMASIMKVSARHWIHQSRNNYIC